MLRRPVTRRREAAGTRESAETASRSAEPKTVGVEKRRQWGAAVERSTCAVAFHTGPLGVLAGAVRLRARLELPLVISFALGGRGGLLLRGGGGWGLLLGRYLRRRRGCVGLHHGDKGIRV